MARVTRSAAKKDQENIPKEAPKIAESAPKKKAIQKPVKEAKPLKEAKPVKEIMPKTVKGTFERYANDPEDKLPGKIGPNGIVRLLADLELDSMDRQVLIMAQKMGAEVACEFSWDEWQKGMAEMGANSVETLCRSLADLDKGLKDVALFAPTYKFAFGYGKKPGTRNLDLDVAVPFWEILFKDECAHLARWLKFMQDVNKKAVTKDVWNQTLEFVTTVKADFSDYDEEASWPSVFDEFVKWARKLNA